jgi:hypothetical protein
MSIELIEYLTEELTKTSSIVHETSHILPIVMSQLLSFISTFIAHKKNDV